MTEANIHPELVFGLVGPIGVDMDLLSNKLCAALTAVGYTPHTIRATEIMRQVGVDVALQDTSDPQKHYESRIDYANAVREKCKNNAAIAGLAILAIREIRARENSNLVEHAGTDEDKLADIPLAKHAFVIRQFKRKEEIDLLRKVYGRKFVQVSANVNAQERQRSLSRRMASQNPDLDKDTCDGFAKALISRDANESAAERGQRVGDVFQMGDVFVDARNDASVDSTIKRFVDAFFGKNAISPSKDEYGAYIAASAALRSLDTSRQVGAAIFTSQGEVIALGSNEVPKAGGGTYWSNDPDPHRDFDDGYDANTTNKRRILYDLIHRLRQTGFIKSAKSDTDLFSEIAKNDAIDDALVMDITEFGRMTHAEMNAITDAARLGRPLKGATLFCTTFPCHNCAKHIVASGIERVVFIEPYPKSKALELHDDSITTTGEAGVKVSFEHFHGISPRRYRDIFEKQKRRDGEGVMRDWYEGEAAPRIEDRGPHHVFNEPSAVFSTMEAVAQELGLTD